MERRASILKRKSLNYSIANESMQDVNTNKDAKRVSFHSSNFVKPFATDPEKNTIWDNTYEEAVSNTDSTKSNENTVTGMSQISVTAAVPEVEDLQILRVSHTSKAKVKIATQIEEYDKENYVPIARMPLNTSKMDMDMNTKGNTKTGLDSSLSYLDVQEATAGNDPDITQFSQSEESSIEFTCTYQNQPILENIVVTDNIDLPNISSSNTTTFEPTPDMELTTVLSTDIVSSQKCIEQHQGLKAWNNQLIQESFTNFSLADDYTGIQLLSQVMDFTSTSSNKQNMTAVMEITCASNNKEAITSNMDFTLASNNKQFASSKTENVNIGKNAFEGSKLDIVKKDDDSLLNRFASNNNTSDMDFTMASNNKQCASSKTENVNIGRNAFESSKLDIVNKDADSLLNRFVQEESSFKINKKKKSFKTDSGSSSVKILSNQLIKLSAEEIINLTKKMTTRSDPENFNDSAQTSDSAGKQYKTRSNSKSQVTNLSESRKLIKQKDTECLKNDARLSDLNDHGTVSVDQQMNPPGEIVATDNPVSFSNNQIIPGAEKKTSSTSKPQNRVVVNAERVSEKKTSKNTRSKRILNESERQSTMETELNTNTTQLNTENKELTFSKTPNKLEATYTITPGLNLTDNNHDASSQNASDASTQSNTEVISTPKPNVFQMVNTPGTSFAWILSNSSSTDPPGKPIYTSIPNKGRLNPPQPTEGSLASTLQKEVALSNSTDDLSFSNILQLNPGCMLSDTCPPLDMYLDNTEPPAKLTLETDKSVQRNLFGLLQDSKDKIQTEEENSKLDVISVPNTEEEEEDIPFEIKERLAAPRVVFDNTPINKDLLKKLEDTNKRLLELVANFKVPDFLTLNYAERERLEYEDSESSISRFSDGLLGADNNSVEDADFETPKSLMERLQEQAKRSIKFWQFVREDDNIYSFYTFYKGVPFRVHVNPNSETVKEIETFINLIDDALPYTLYQARFMQEKLKMDNLLLALGSNFDILTLLDYVVICMEEIKAFAKWYEEVEHDFGHEYKLRIDPEFSIVIEVLHVEFVFWWEITLELSMIHLGSITGVKAHHNKIGPRSSEEPVDEEHIKKIVEDTEGEGQLFIRNFINNLNLYVEREGRKRKGPRRERLMQKYSYLNLFS